MRAGCALLLVGGLLFALADVAHAQDEFPPMKYTEVREIAPGVFFRYSAISATDKTVVFGGSNNIWIVFDEYVLVYDANFPKEAGDVIAAVSKTTDRPIRYVVDSHHHGDHAYGNAVFAQIGATVVAQANCARLLRVDGPKEFADAGKGKGGRKDVADSFLKVPDLIFDEKLVFDDGKQRAELYFFGHAHTAGDAFLYLPKHKIVCTGDACTNGPFNYMGHSDSASWVRVLDKALQLDPKIVCPGHGPLGGKDVLAKQRRFFVELRDHVKKGIDKGQDVEQITKTIDMPWHKEWTGVEASERGDAITHVFDEFIGRTMPWDLVEDFGIYEGPSPTKKSPGWTPPKRIVVQAVMPAKLLELKRIAPDVLFVPVRDAEEAAKEAGDADAVLGFCTPEIVNAGAKLRWIQIGHAGVEKELSPAVVKSNVVVTNTARIYGSNVADQGMALLLGLTRAWRGSGSRARRDAHRRWPPTPAVELLGVGEEKRHGRRSCTARRCSSSAWAASARRWLAALTPSACVSWPSTRTGRSFGRRLSPVWTRLPSSWNCCRRRTSSVLACPLTEQTRGMFGTTQFAAMKKSALFINVARGGLVRNDALVEALKTGDIAGAGLDVTDPEPLDNNNVLWKLTNVIVTPHVGGQSPEARDRQWRLTRENVRRFVAGEPLLCVVDKQKGY